MWEKKRTIRGVFFFAVWLFFFLQRERGKKSLARKKQTSFLRFKGKEKKIFKIPKPGRTALKDSDEEDF